jgi:hypothetical protein
VPETSLIKIEDALGLSKPLTRLIEVIAEGVGGVTAPYLIRKTAEARAHEIKTISDALKNVAENAKLPVVYQAGDIEVWQKPEDGTLALSGRSIDERSAARRDYQERKRQENIEKITTVAAAELARESAVPEERPDPDWVARFFGSAEDITSQQLQELWGRILAGEIRKPGSYSLCTLQLVRNINQEDAELFERVGRLALRPGAVAMIPVEDKDWLGRQRNIYPSHQFTLAELGLMYPTDLAFLCFKNANETQTILLGDDYFILVKRGNITGEFPLKIWKFTEVGRQLLSLVSKPLDEDYYEKVGEFFVTRGGQVAIAKVTQRLGDKISYDVVKEIKGPEVKPPPPPTREGAESK